MLSLDESSWRVTLYGIANSRWHMAMAAGRGLSRALPFCLALLALAPCNDNANQQAAQAAPPVTVAQPTRRTVTDWDEFTGRFDAIEQVLIRARVTGFVTSVEFKDGAIVKAGDLLYVIDPRQYEAVAEQ